MAPVRRVLGPALLVLAVLSTAAAETLVCPANSGCVWTVTKGQTVTLTATPEAGAIFKRWTGACTGYQTSCRASLNQAQNATAWFERPPDFTSTIGALAEVKQDLYHHLYAIRKWTYDNGRTVNYSGLSRAAVQPYLTSAQYAPPGGCDYGVDSGRPNGFRFWVWCGWNQSSSAQWASELWTLFQPYGASNVFVGWGGATSASVEVWFDNISAGYRDGYK